MSDDLQSRFEQAAIDIKSLKTRPSDDDMLALYALYKQGSSGDVTGTKPGFFDFVGAAKFDAWSQLAGTDQDEAKERYIAKVTELVNA